MNTPSLALLDIFWLYDLLSWQFCAVVITAYVAFALTGQHVVRRFLPRWFGDREYNDIVGQYLSASGVFFGITLGLLSVGAWENFSGVDEVVSQEASNVGVLYRTLDNYPEPHRTVLTDQLRAYTRNEIDVAWPLQNKGIMPGPEGNAIVTDLHHYLTRVEPSTEAQKALHAEALRQFSNMVESRRLRIGSVSTQLPSVVWLVVLGGSVLNLSLMWLLVVGNKLLHDLLTVILAGLLGLLVFLLAIMDHPFRGTYSVGPDAFEIIYDRVMKK